MPAAGAGNLETKASRDHYQFSVPAGGQAVYIDPQACPTYMRWRLVAPTGTVLVEKACYQGDAQLDLPAGDYSLQWFSGTC